MESVDSFFEILYANLPSLFGLDQAVWIPKMKGVFEVQLYYNALRSIKGFFPL